LELSGQKGIQVEMRILCLFFSLMVLMQSSLPCRDDIVSSKPASASYQKKESQTPSQQKDDCSPFCVCICCSTPSMQQTEPIIAVSFSSICSDYPLEDVGGFIDISLPVWQPPKLS